MTTKPKRKGEIFPSLRRFFGKAITLLRGKMSMETLAKKAGMDPTTLSRLEKGKGPLREDYVEDILRNLDATLPDLLRKAADCYEEAAREGGPSIRERPTGDLLDRLGKIDSDIARLEAEARPINLEIKRRQIKENH